MATNTKNHAFSRPQLVFGALAIAGLLTSVQGCTGCTPEPVVGHGPIAPLVTGPLGSPRGGITPEQAASFERGEQVLKHRFTLEEGLGPEFNVTFCGACHERPVFGGSAGLYRNFFLTGRVNDEGAFRAGPRWRRHSPLPIRQPFERQFTRRHVRPSGPHPARPRRGP